MSEKIYACLLRLFPSRFRQAYGEEALLLFRDRIRDEKGFFPVLRLWLDLLIDLVVSVPREYRYVRPELTGVSASVRLDEMPSFHVLEPKLPSARVLLFGGVLSLVTLSLISVLISSFGSLRPLRASVLESQHPPVSGSPGEATSANPHRQRLVAWHDPSPHNVHFVTVDKNVKLEVLDWGGAGRPVVLLAGLGNTVHVYDDFAPKLTPQYHVYGITRRGFGASSAPVPNGQNYSADRLGDDVLAVLDALKIARPVLVGHSIAGEELSSVGSRHPERIAGLIYLDAGYCYAYYGQSLGCLTVDVAELQRKLRQLVNAGPAGNFPLAQDLLQNDLPILERDLRAVQRLQLPRPPNPAPADLATFQAFSAWFTRNLGIAIPVSEHRATSAETRDGRPAGPKTPPSIPEAILSGEQRYTRIQVPVLAIYAFPHEFPPFVERDPAALAAVKVLDSAMLAQQKAFEKGVPSARVVRLPHANHYVFISNQADVLREMRAFINALPQ